MAKDNNTIDMENSVRENERADYQRWGYAVCVGTIVTFIACVGHISSFGLLFNDFIVNTNSTSKSVTTAYGVFAMMLPVGGLILNITTKYCSTRTGGLIGALCYACGSFATILISNTDQLTFTFGILQGTGFGIMVPVCYSMINQYFVKKRITVMSICKAVQGIIQVIYPQALNAVLKKFGFRGTLLFLSGIALHTIPGMLVMVPKESFEKNKAREQDVQFKEKMKLMKTDCTKLESADMEQKADTLWKRIKLLAAEWLCLRFLTDGVFLNICVCQSLVNFSDLCFFMIQPMWLLQSGFDKHEVATCISVGAGADVAGRFFLAVASSFLAVNTRMLYYASAALTAIVRIVLLYVSGPAWVAVVTGVLGFLRAWLHVASPLILAESVPREDFPGAYGLFLLIAGIISMICNPLVGATRDAYQDYAPSFYVLVACCLPCLVFWPMEYFLTNGKACVTKK